VATTNGRIYITYERERNTLRSILSFFSRGQRVEIEEPKPIAHVDVSKAEHFLAALTVKHGPIAAADAVVVTDAATALLLDGPALLALAAGNVRARAYVGWAVRSHTRVVAPATSFLDPTAASVAAAVADVLPIYASTAELAATLLSRARLSLPFDALSVALASKLRPAAILTRDVAGIGALVRATNQTGISVFPL